VIWDFVIWRSNPEGPEGHLSCWPFAAASGCSRKKPWAGSPGEPRATGPPSRPKAATARSRRSSPERPRAEADPPSGGFWSEQPDPGKQAERGNSSGLRIRYQLAANRQIINRKRAQSRNHQITNHQIAKSPIHKMQASRARIFRISRSSVPWTRSDGRLVRSPVTAPGRMISLTLRGASA